MDVSKTKKSGAGREYAVGTLVVDLRDPATNQPLFRARIDQPIDTEPEKLEAAINAAVTAMFEKYPTRTAETLTRSEQRGTCDAIGRRQQARGSGGSDDHANLTRTRADALSVCAQRIVLQAAIVARCAAGNAGDTARGRRANPGHGLAVRRPSGSRARRDGQAVHRRLRRDGQASR